MTEPSTHLSGRLLWHVIGTVLFLSAVACWDLQANAAPLKPGTPRPVSSLLLRAFISLYFNWDYHCYVAFWFLWLWLAPMPDLLPCWQLIPASHSVHSHTPHCHFYIFTHIPFFLDSQTRSNCPRSLHVTSFKEKSSKTLKNNLCRWQYRVNAFHMIIICQSVIIHKSNCFVTMHLCTSPPFCRNF